MNIGSSSVVNGTYLGADHAGQRDQRAETAPGRSGPAVRDRHLPPRPATAAQRRGRSARRSGLCSGRARSDAVVAARGPRGAGRSHPTARERNVGWQRGHQNRLRPASIAGPHRRAADEAGLAGAPVDVDLSPVVVHARRPAHRLGRVLGPHGVDPAGAHALVPSARPGRPTSRRNWLTRSVLPGPQRVDPVPEQHLGAVDVADACQHRLVHQQVTDRRAAAPDPRPGPRRVGVGPQRVRAEPREDRRRRCAAVIRSQSVAPRRSAYAAARADDQPQPHLPDRGGGAPVGPSHVELADQPEVDVHEPLAARTPRTGACPADSAPTSTGAVEQRGVGREPALRAAAPAPRGRRTPPSARRRAGAGCAPQASSAERPGW